MSKYAISKSQARRFLLWYQNLYPPRKLEGKSGILSFIKKAGCLQYDPLNIAGRNADLVLQSRIKNYNAEILTELLYQDRQLVDGWDKMMSIYSVEDWPYFRRVREKRSRQVRKGLSRCNSELFTKQALQVISDIKQKITEQGALSSLDFSLPSLNPGSWGHRNIASAALNYLFHKGELGIEKKINTRKVYNLMESLIPDEIYQTADPFASEEDFYEWYYHRRIGSVGLVWRKSSEIWLGQGLRKNDKKNANLDQLYDREMILEFQIDGIDSPFYIQKEYEQKIKNIESESLPAEASIIAPLDNLIWDRKMIEALFGFSYTWEVYTPVSKRKYGYYVLPVLFADRFIARFEPLYDKKTKELLIKNWWWEEDVTITDEMKNSLKKCLVDFRHYLGAGKIIDNSSLDLKWLL